MPTVENDRFLSVTELAGDDVTTEQVARLADRYTWAAEYSAGKDIVEVACGTGQGLGILAAVASSVVGGDISPGAVERGRLHYGTRVEILEFPAERLPFEERSKDVIVIFEAIYYLPSMDVFLAECRRVLRPGGQVLIATANKDLPDFNPSPYSSTYYNMEDLRELLRSHGFVTEFFGNTPLETLSARQMILRPVKRLAIRLNLMPKTMAGKKLLKRLVFGTLVPMPAEVKKDQGSGIQPVPLADAASAVGFKVIFCAASLP